MQDNKLEEFITDFTKTIEKDNSLKYGELANSLKKELLNSNYDMSNPEIYYTMFQFKLETILEEVIRSLHKKQENSIADNYKPQFIYLNYNYLSNNIEKLLTKKRGISSCCADVSRTILKMYLEYALTGFIPETNYEEHYWLPRFGKK